MSTGHSRFAPSAAHRWMRCPGSITLSERLAAEDRTSIHAAEGTVAHDIAARCLETGVDASLYHGTPVSVDGFDFVVDEDMAAYVQVYVDAIRRRPGTLLVEQRFDLSDVLGVPAFGTADAVLLDFESSTLEVHDLKFGRGVQVDAKDNEQLRLYAAGALSAFEKVHDWQTVRMFIHQPRLDHMDEDEMTVQELHQFSYAARYAVTLAEDDEPALNPGEKQCRWCPAKAFCLALAAYVAEAVGAGVPDDGEALAEARSKVPLVEEWCAAICKETESRLAAGQSVPGWKLVQGRRGSRAWRDEQEAEALALAQGADEAALYKRSLITPTQAQKALEPSVWGALEALVVQPDGKPQVAPESDKRPALVVGADAFDNLD